jgi:hypothetical protein
MKLNRLIVCVYSVVAIFAMVIYLSGDAMSDPKKDKAKQDNDEFVAPDSETFGESGSDTFSESPTPTFQTGRSKVPLGKQRTYRQRVHFPTCSSKLCSHSPTERRLGQALCRDSLSRFLSL